MSLTADKRERFPSRYARKDARTLVYRALYGVPDNGQQSNDPALCSRRFPYHWNYQNAQVIFKANIEACELTSAQVAHLERRLDNLRHFKHNEPVEA